ELSHVGLRLEGSVDPAQVADGLHAVWLGITTAGTKITGVIDGSPAQVAGLSPGDELVAIDGFRVTNDGDIRNLCATRPIGEPLRVALFPRHPLLELCPA